MQYTGSFFVHLRTPFSVVIIHIVFVIRGFVGSGPTAVFTIEPARPTAMTEFSIRIRRSITSMVSATVIS